MPKGPNYYGHVGNIDRVWDKAEPIRGIDASLMRVDAARQPMLRSAYGTSGVGSWEIDHIKPKSRNGSDYIRNLQPLNTHTNRSYGNRGGKPH